MKINGLPYRTIWVKKDDPSTVQILDQRHLPHSLVIADLRSVEDVARALKEMQVRGAGLIGVTAGYGMYLAALKAAPGDFEASMEYAAATLVATRPTAVNLAWAVERQQRAIAACSPSERLQMALLVAQTIADEDAASCRRIGEHGLALIQDIAERKHGQTVNILTHCNAGWLAFVDYGSATAPIYAAQAAGIGLHVWVDETRPRSQGAKLTAYELLHQGVPHTLIADNTGGHLMQHGMVDLVIVGADRVTRTGDVANKIGTYLKALAARDNDVPFYVALPSTSFDWRMRDGVREIPIEERGGEEVRMVEGLCEGQVKTVLVAPEGSPVANYGFDVTPARLVSGLISERGICPSTEAGILGLYPERAS